ncbi:uncharacterized protein LOC123354890 isoform X4 [Mauremys mutica]|nr:uncharacterized protein LOC123354890 isoform X4 [Mauremys mutica]XP_044853211.1 uncharacterized protein LOC123354890 isoform X4 [Mauremys mutica]XP_044853212.1 uncharacterized protein LOC123354890 isoform X4 [Mauremys mutica]
MKCEDNHGPSCPHEEHVAQCHYSLDLTQLAWNLVDSFLSQLLLEELVPDVLLETFTEFIKDQRQQPLKSSNGKSKGEKSQHLRESMSTLKHLPDSLLDELFVEVLRDLSADAFRGAMKDFVDDYLTRAAISDSMDGLVAEVVQMVLPSILREALQEMEYEAILQEVISHVIKEDAKALAQSVLSDYDAKRIKLQQSQITACASKQLLDLFLLEHLIGMTSTHPPGFGGKEHSSVVLDSWMLDILIRQFFSIQEQQRTTSENVPLGDFHRKAFIEVALDVILTELNKLAEEDMEDLLEHERGAQFFFSRGNPFESDCPVKLPSILILQSLMFSDLEKRISPVFVYEVHMTFWPRLEIRNEHSVHPANENI